MSNPLDTIFIGLTEAGTEKAISLQASLIGAIVENARGTTDVWTKLHQDGDSKVFIVEEEAKDIREAMREGFLSVTEKGKKK